MSLIIRKYVGGFCPGKTHFRLQSDKMKLETIETREILLSRFLKKTLISLYSTQADPVHRLISTFVFHCLDSMISLACCSFAGITHLSEIFPDADSS